MSAKWSHVGLMVCLLALSMSHLLWGEVEIDVASLWKATSEINSTTRTILFEIRLPRVIMAIAAGAGLGVAGLLLQTWFHNPLAGPSVLGISAGAGMGVAIMVLAGLGTGWIANTLGATVGSWSVLLMVLVVASRFRGLASLLIFGLMLNYVLGALITILQAEAPKDALQQFVFWGMGTFGQSTGTVSTLIFGLVIVSIWFAWTLHRHLDAWTLGSVTARSMGVSENRLKWMIISVTGLVAGTVTAACGPIAFLGLATPHLVKLGSTTRSHGTLIWRTAMVGAIIALVADWGVKGVFQPGQGWPLNAVLSILGGPMVVWVLLSKSKLS